MLRLALGRAKEAAQFLRTANARLNEALAAERKALRNAVRQVVTVAKMNGVQRSFFTIGLICTAVLLLAVVYKIAKWVRSGK